MSTTPQQGPLGFYVNLDERGSFYADVRNALGDTVFELRAEGEELDLVEDGFMKHKTDIDGLSSYLASIGVIEEKTSIMEMSAFEAELDAASPDFG